MYTWYQEMGAKESRNFGVTLNNKFNVLCMSKQETWFFFTFPLNFSIILFFHEKD